MGTAEASVGTLLERVAALAREANVFSGVEIRGSTLVCQAKGAASPASYRLSVDGGRLYVSLVMADRWLSESIEADLMHTGDRIEDLLEEELVDRGYEGPPPRVEHFRSDDLLFTFRTPVPAGPAAADTVRNAGIFLLAYEACFRNLGDMHTGEAA